MKSDQRVETPSPTIVGARPAPGSRGQMDVPRGIERLLVLAGSSGQWKQKMLADPFGAAREAGIELSPGERGILEALPRNALAQMIAPFEKRAVSGAWARLAGAAAVAAAALLSGTGALAEETPVKPKPETPTGEKDTIPWADNFADAMAKATQAKSAIMLVFPHPDVDSTGDRPATGEISLVVRGAVARRESVEQKSQRVILSKNKALAAAVESAKLVAVKVAWPERPADARGGAGEEKLQQAVKDYWALLKKYDIEGKLPAVVFAASDGSLLSKAIKPETETALTNEIKAVPALLEKWLAGKGDAPKAEQPLDKDPAKKD